jgi:hypothetical protein
MDQEEREALELTKEDLLAMEAAGSPVGIALIPPMAPRQVRVVARITAVYWPGLATEDEPVMAGGTLSPTAEVGQPHPIPAGLP